MDQITDDELRERQERLDEHFAQLMDSANDHSAWLRTVRNLLSAAELVMLTLKAGRLLIRGPLVPRTEAEDRLVSRAIQTGSSVLMLYAFALECLMKALYLKRGGVLYRGGKLQRLPGLRGAGTSHDLVRISQAVGVVFDSAQLEVLDKLTMYTETGRYPLPASASALGTQLVRCEEDGVRIKSRQVWSFTEERRIYEMLALLYRELDTPMPEYAEVLLLPDRNDE